ncbi:MAG: hypothetical protein ABUL67_02985, partial [Haliangium ochraceum]
MTNSSGTRSPTGCFDMRPLGFSTGALALGDFRSALAMLVPYSVKAVELSALRDKELMPLMAALPNLDLGRFDYVSVHVPSKFLSMSESDVATALDACPERRIPVVLHPDAIRDASCWRRFGSLLCIENMDKRKKTGRTADELASFFDVFPEASLCFDVAHARQVDSTMSEGRNILRRFGSRLSQIHISELDTTGHHHRLSM